jgi:hypothetical protein
MSHRLDCIIAIDQSQLYYVCHGAQPPRTFLSSFWGYVQYIQARLIYENDALQARLTRVVIGLIAEEDLCSSRSDLSSSYITYAKRTCLWQPR